MLKAGYTILPAHDKEVRAIVEELGSAPALVDGDGNSIIDWQQFPAPTGSKLPSRKRCFGSDQSRVPPMSLNVPASDGVETNDLAFESIWIPEGIESLLTVQMGG